MRILYVSAESPLTPSGGIATYLGIGAKALQDAGHDVFLFTWTEDPKGIPLPPKARPFHDQNTHVEILDSHVVWRATPSGYSTLQVGLWLRDRILAVMQEWQIDVVEAIDWQAPCLPLFQHLQSCELASQHLLATFNHGFMDTFFEADHFGLTFGQQIDNLNERQQCRVSDIVIAPSRCAKDRLEELGIAVPTEIVREPYEFHNAQSPFQSLAAQIEYIGRISMSKGMDKLVYCANVLDEILPLSRLRLIGRLVDPPFRAADAEEYLRQRLHPRLRDKLELTGFLQRDIALKSLTPGAIQPSLGSAETFSYACVEGIDAGLFPVVRQGTPMAEFYPDHLQDYVLKSDLGTAQALGVDLDRLCSAAESLMPQITEHCRETLLPTTFANRIEETYAPALAHKRGTKSYRVASQRICLDDITILIPAYRPTHEIRETIDTICAQSAGLPKVIICADGALDKHGVYVDYAHARLPDLTVVQQRNSGLLATRNTLIDACTTKISVFLDVDDMLAPNFLERGITAYNESPFQPAAVLFQRQSFGQNADQSLHTPMDDHLHLLENEFRMTGLIQTGVLREIDFPSDRRNGEADDWIFWLEFTLRGYQAILVPETNFWYRMHDNSMSWPWSEGQHVGSMSMLKDTLMRGIEKNPAVARKMALAIFARSVRK